MTNAEANAWTIATAMGEFYSQRAATLKEMMESDDAEAHDEWESFTKDEEELVRIVAEKINMLVSDAILAERRRWMEQGRN